MRVEIDRHTPCWLWEGRTQNGRARFKGKPAYRVTYTLLIGTPPRGMDGHHICENAMCVNPWHIEWLTRAEHGQRHGHASKVRCPQGHKYTPENTHYTRHGHRKCRACNRDRARQRRAERNQP
jgi:hypothetical protein